MMTDDQKADWDRWADSLDTINPIIPPERGTLEFPATLFQAANRELEEWRSDHEQRSGLVLAVIVLVLTLRCAAGWFANEITRPYRGHHAHSTAEPIAGTARLLGADRRTEASQAVL